MKKKILSMLLAGTMMVCFSVPSFAAETVSGDAPDTDSTLTESSSVLDESLSEQEEEELLEDVITEMQDAQDDGSISKSEQTEIFSDIPVEVIDEYNDIAQEEAADIIEEECSDTEIDSNAVVHEKETYDLDCGAQLTIETDIVDIPDQEVEEDTVSTEIAKIMDRFGMYAYANSQSYGTKKHCQKYTMVAGGTVKLTLTTTIKASSSGLKITGTSATSNSNGVCHDTSRKSKIEKASAGKGASCKALGGVQWYTSLIPYGHTSKKWQKLRQTFSVSSINKTKKVVNFSYSTKTFSSSSW